MSAWMRWLYGRVEWMNKRNVFNLIHVDIKKINFVKRG